jgi:hypothetical protein
MTITRALRTSLAVAMLGALAFSNQPPPPEVATQTSSAGAMRSLDLAFLYQDVGATAATQREAFDRAARLAATSLRPTPWHQVAFDPKHAPSVRAPVKAQIDDAPPEGTRVIVVESDHPPVIPYELGVTVAWIDTSANRVHRTS